MIPNALARVFATPLSASVLFLGLATNLHAAPETSRSMMSLMHLDHEADAHAMPVATDSMAGAEANTVLIKNFHFAPMALSIPAGTTVTWKNMDGEPHTVVSIEGVFRSGGLDQDDSFTFKFDKPGTYKFLCSIHPQMLGTITVN